MRSVDTCPSNTCWAHHLATIAIRANRTSRLAVCSEKKKDWRVQSKENRVWLGSAWRETGGMDGGVGYGITSYFIHRVWNSAVI